MKNGPDGRVMEGWRPNGHEEEVAPLKRVLLRAIPELREELEYVGPLEIMRSPGHLAFYWPEKA